MSGSADRARVRAVVEPPVTAAGYDLETVEVTPAGKRRVVRVVVDRDGGVDLDAVAEVSRAISAALDDTDALGSAPYVLEVTSPGVDRPLTEPRHWRRAAGRLVSVPLTAGGQASGRVRSADDEGVILQDEAGAEVRYAYAELGRGRVEVEFRRDQEEGP
jgi:ribosome maturation factor RimP